MQLQEKVARDLRQSTVVLTTTSPRGGGDYGGGIGTIVGSKYLVTSKHCVTGPRIYVWHTEDELKQDFSLVRRWDMGENSLVEVDKAFPFPPYPVSRKPISEVMQPGATIVYPAGYEFYIITEGHSRQMPMNVGVYNGPAGGNSYLGWGRIRRGTSGSGIVSLEDQVLVGIVYGDVTISNGGLQQHLIFHGANNLADLLDKAGIPEPPEKSVYASTASQEQMLPEVQNRYLRWGIIGLAGIGGLMALRFLLE